MQAPSVSAAGFTLIEMMISLVLVSLVGIAGLSLVDSLSTVQLRTDDRYVRITDLQIFLTGFSEDLEQAVSPTLTLANGRLELETRRCGRPELVVYEFVHTSLTRSPGSCVPGGTAAVNLTAGALRVLDDTGQLLVSWPVDPANNPAIAAPAPPQAVGVELEMSLKNEPAMPSGEVRWLADIPQAPAT